MKWKKKTRPLPNDTRTITKFCLFPKEVNGWIYWLQTITIKQRFVSNGFDLQYWYNDEVVE